VPMHRQPLLEEPLLLRFPRVLHLLGPVDARLYKGRAGLS
jgi:hypothetical protein